eukprot:s2571_g4.t1
MNLDIQFDHGQGFVISVPAHISAADIEHNLADRIRRQRLLRPRHSWEDPDPEEPEATHPRRNPSEDQSHDGPEDVTSFMARSHLTPAPPTAAVSQDSSSDIGDTSSSDMTGGDEWRLSRVFCLDGTTADIDAPWDDADNLWNIVASNFNIPVADVIRVMHVGSRPADLQQADLECLLLQRRQDEPAVDFLRLVLIDVEYKADSRGAAMPLERKSKWIPRRTTRESLIRLLGYDGHCAPNPARCDIWINDHYIDVDAAILRLTNGDYVRAAVPSHPEDPQCDQENLETNQSMSSDAEFLQFLTEEDALLQTTPNVIKFTSSHRAVLGDITNQPHLCKIDEHDEVQGRDFVEPLLPAPEEGRPELQLGEHFECLQQLQAIWTHHAATEVEEEGRVLYVSTWYSDSTRWPRCAAPRPVRLLANAALWINHIAEAWDDRVDPDAVLHVYLLKPQPRQDLWDTGVQPHVLIVQNPTAGLRSVHFSTLNTMQVHAGLRQHVDIVSAQTTKDIVLQALRLLETCVPHSDIDCMVWWGDVELRGQDQLPVQDGYSIFVIYNQLQAEFGHSGASSSSTAPVVPRPSPGDIPPDADEEEDRPVSLLQLSSKTTRRVVLLEQALGYEQSEQERQTGIVVAHAYRPCSDTAPTETTFAQLWSPSAALQLPTYIEIPSDGTEAHVVAELCHWGHQCKALRFGDKPLYLCIPASHVPEQHCHHYAYHHDDLGDPKGAILHTSNKPMTTQQHLTFLCDLGYDRAVLTYVGQPESGFCCISFLQCNPSISKNEPMPRQRTPWPERQLPTVPLGPVYQCAQHSSVSGPCHVSTPFNSDDLRQLFAAGNDFLCTDFTLFPLPDFVQQVMQPPDTPIEFDRWLIYTDGSSQSKMRHHTPEYVDATDRPDSWAMLVVGEQYQPDGSSTTHPIGWTAHTVRYDEAGANFAGATRIGAELAEREGMLWAGLWRATQNSTLPTLFCVDSSTTGAQAFGNMGAHNPDLSYRLLRGVFQYLKIGLPHGHVGLHHVRAHAGDPFNEFVDLAAKREAQQSFNHPRMPLNMQSWQHKLPYLWLLFADRLGLPPWNEGLCVPPPALPCVTSTTSSTSSTSHHIEVIQGELSLATMNVLAISKAPDGHAERLHFLFEQVKSFGLNIVGIQEGRNPEGLSNTHGIYRICAGDDRGQLGVELWVNLRQPLGYDAQGHPICLHPRCFQVVHKDPRRLVVRCDHDVFTGWFLVAHGPHSGLSLTQRKEWWHQTEDLIQSLTDDSPWFWLIDANAAPGPADENVVFVDHLTSSANTSLFRDCLAACDLCLPSTSDRHHGDRNTWTAPNGQDHYCIDYVAIPQTWLPHCVYSGVLENFELGHLRDDHLPVALQLSWRTSRSIGSGRKPCSRSTDALWTCASNRTQIATCLEQLTPAPWHTDVEQQADKLTSDLTGVLCDAVQKPLCIKKPYIDLPIWNLRSQKLQHRKRLNELNRRLARHLLAHLFGAWKCQHLDDINILAEQQFAVSLHCWRTKAYFAHRAVALKLRQALRSAKSRVLNTTLAQLDEKTSASQVLHCLRPFIGPTNLKHCKKKTIPLVKDRHGRVCRNASEALDTWIEFFRNMEGGQRTTWQTLRTHWHAELAAGREETLSIDATELPTLTDLELAMRRTACGRARGHDSIPGGLLHHCPVQVAALVYPSVWKLMLHGQEDLQYKGGKLVQAYKGRGERDSCSSFRSLLISSQIGKSIHRTIRSRQADIFERFLQKQQVGGRRRQPVTYGLHLVRAHLRCARKNGRSAAVFFVDLTEAFYRIFRPLCMNNGITDEALAAFLHKLQMPHSALQELWALLEGPTSAETLELFPDAAPCELQPTQAFLGPTWMDDTAICLDGTTPSSTIDRALLTAGKLLELCIEHGLSPNLKKGKTELLLSLRGRHSRQAKLNLFGPDAPDSLPVITEHQVLQVPLTRTYIHLGGLLHHQPDQREEVRRRLAQAHAAFTQHRRLLYHNAQIPFAKRRELFQVLVITKLMYGAESWHVTDNQTIHHFHSAVLRLYLRLLRAPHDQHFYDDELLAKVGLPAPDILLRRQRLRYLCTLLQSGSDNDWGLLSADRDWCILLEDDLTWLWMQLRHCSSLKPPHTSFHAWRHLILRHPGYWKRLIRRAVQHSIMQTQRVWRIKEFYMAALPSLCQIFDSKIDLDWDLAEPAEQAHYGCLHCRLRCATRAGEAAHMFKVHKVVSKIRFMITEPSCPACLKYCHTMQKTKAHVYYLRDAAQGPLNRTPRLRDDPGIDENFFVALTDGIAPGMSLTEYTLAIEEYATDHPISWTTWCRTLNFFEESFTQEDAEFATVPLADVHCVLQALRRPERFDFLLNKVHVRKAPISIAALEDSCRSIDTSAAPLSSPQGFGRHRVLLHAFAGLRQYWLDAIKDYKVAAFLAGPPCETWSAAREHSLEPADGSDEAPRGPRVLRDQDFLWGFESLSLRELAQILVGNELLLFAFEAILGLVHTQGVALLEHPAEPQKKQSASIWKTPFLQQLVRAPNVERHRFAQGLMGAPTPKPTELLTLNLPGILRTLHKWRVRSQLPKNFALGKNQQGEWCTAVLKEYPPAMCGSLAESIYGALLALPSRSVQEPKHDLDLWHRLAASEYGAALGPDYAG